MGEKCRYIHLVANQLTSSYFEIKLHPNFRGEAFCQFAKMVQHLPYILGARVRISLMLKFEEGPEDVAMCLHCNARKKSGKNLPVFPGSDIQVQSGLAGFA